MFYRLLRISIALEQPQYYWTKKTTIYHNRVDFAELGVLCLFAYQETAVQIFNALLNTFLTDVEQPLAEIELSWSALQTTVSPTETTPNAPRQNAYVPPRDRLELDLKIKSTQPKSDPS